MGAELTQRPRHTPVADARKARRDQQIRRVVREIRKLAPYCDDVRYVPLLRSFAEVTVLCERAYAFLSDAGLVNESGEFRDSVTTFRQLTETQRSLARELGLSPTTVRSFTHERRVDAFERARDAIDETTE